MKDRIPVKRFEKTVMFELLDFEALDDEEKAAVSAALEAQKKSEDLKFQVGAAALAFDGTMVSTHNDIPGPHGHAEQRVLSKLYTILPAGEKKLKLLAMAGAMPGEEVVRTDKPYTAEVGLDDVEWGKPCPKCLEYIHDRTANVPDVKILSVAATGQVMRTTLRSLLTSPHTSVQVPLDRWSSPAEENHGK